MDYREELLKHVGHLLRILRQMLKAGNSSNQVFLQDEDGRSITINIFLHELAAGDDEYADSWSSSDEDVLDAEWFTEHFETEPLRFELSERDVDFLRANGLSF